MLFLLEFFNINSNIALGTSEPPGDFDAILKHIVYKVYSKRKILQLFAILASRWFYVERCNTLPLPLPGRRPGGAPPGGGIASARCIPRKGGFNARFL